MPAALRFCTVATGLLAVTTLQPATCRLCDADCKKIPVVLLSYNNPTFLRLMVRQLQDCFNASVQVIDNGSDFPPMREYLSELETTSVTVHRMPKNLGPHILFDSPQGEEILKALPQHFVLSDSDLRLGDNTPANFLCILACVAEYLSAAKVGLALDLADNDQMFHLPNYQHGRTIVEWESYLYKASVHLKHWPELANSVFEALVDTTFAMYNKTYLAGFDYNGYRVGGIFSAKHRPFYPKTLVRLSQKEIDAMFRGNTGTIASYMRDKGLNLSVPSGFNKLYDSNMLSFTCAGRNNHFPVPCQLAAGRG